MMTLPLLLLLAAPPTPATAQQARAAAEQAKVVLKVGEQRLSPMKNALRCTCENKEIASGFQVDGRIEMLGKAPGTTRCTLLAAGQPDRVIEVTVEKKEAPR